MLDDALDRLLYCNAANARTRLMIWQSRETPSLTLQVQLVAQPRPVLHVGTRLGQRPLPGVNGFIQGPTGVAYAGTLMGLLTVSGDAPGGNDAALENLLPRLAERLQAILQ